MTRNDSTPAIRALQAMGVPFTLFRHDGPIHSLEQAARERNQQPEQVVRSILFRLARDEYVLVLAAGPQQLNWRALRRYLGQSRVSMASQEEVLAVTGYRVGTVSPFGLPAPIRTLVDESVTAQEVVSLGSGERGLAIIMHTADLLPALGDVEMVNLRP